jgi:hypothetical protein
MADLLDELRKLVSVSIAEETDEDDGITILMLDVMIDTKCAEENGVDYKLGFDIDKYGGGWLFQMLAPFPLSVLKDIFGELNPEPK